MTAPAGPMPGPARRPLPPTPTDDHGGLIVYRLWHPARHTPPPATMRDWGPLYRFDPHRSPPDRLAQDPSRRVVWYGGEALETAVREVFDRGPTEVDVCAAYRMAALRLALACALLGCTRHTTTLGAPDDVGDRVIGADYDVARCWGPRHL